MSDAPDDDVLHAEAAAIEGEVLPRGVAGDGDQRAESSPSEPSTGELLTALLRPTFDIMAPAWNVSDAECAALGEAYGALLDKYLPDFDMGVELSAVLVTLAVLGPRMRKPMKHPKQPAGESGDAAAPQAG